MTRPTFTVSDQYMNFDEAMRVVELDAENARVFSDGMEITEADISYDYEILRGSTIAEVTEAGTIRLEPHRTGEFDVRVKVTANYEGRSASREVDFVVTKSAPPVDDERECSIEEIDF